MRNRKILYSFLIFVISLISALVLGANVLAAPISELPTTVTQPNGETLNLFVSGDEYFNYLHDANGNIIIENYNTGYYTFAAIEDGKVIPTENIVTNMQQGDGMQAPINTIIFDDIPVSYIENAYNSSELNPNNQI